MRRDSRYENQLMATPIYLDDQTRSTSQHPPYEREAAAIDAQQLANDLRRVIRGEVRFDRGSRALYATDGSN